MKTSLFDFHLPDSLIATRPASPRDAARMLVVGDVLQDRHVRDLTEYLREGDLLVMNDTRVIPARLFGRRGEANIEFLLHRPHPCATRAPLSRVRERGRERGELWRAFARPAKRLKAGDRVEFAEGFTATVAEKLDSGEVLLAFDLTKSALEAALKQHGHMPLPPDIEKQRAADAQDAQDYQTIYAREGNSVAAPTAGLHFTDALFAALDAKGVSRAYVTLHVGGGTFLPVKVEDTKDHVMHSEWAEVSEETARAVNETKSRGGRVVAVGTTSLRTLESAFANGQLQPFSGETDIFITPGYRFHCADMLLTNFHLPRSTLFMLVCAFAGMERMKAAYAHAVAEQYRFYSYGDACLLSPAP